MATTAKAPKGKVAYLRISTANAETRVACAGAFWAGISEVPADSITELQLIELKADKRLKVEEAEPRDETPPENTAA